MVVLIVPPLSYRDTTAKACEKMVINYMRERWILAKVPNSVCIPGCWFEVYAERIGIRACNYGY